jgi:coatomer protein complex subunit gamma
MSTTSPQPLTETEAEYTVQVIKHMFQQMVVLEFYVTNTLSGVQLKDVQISVDVGSSSNPGAFSVMGELPIEDLDYDESKSCYVFMQKQDMSDLVCCSKMRAEMRFNQLEEGDDIGFPDTCPMEDVEVSAGDYMQPAPLPQGQVKSLFEQLKMQSEATTKLQLEYKNLEAAVAGTIHSMNMKQSDL